MHRAGWRKAKLFSPRADFRHAFQLPDRIANKFGPWGRALGMGVNLRDRVVRVKPNPRAVPAFDRVNKTVRKFDTCHMHLEYPILVAGAHLPLKNNE